MKKVLFSLVAVLFIGLSAQAQFWIDVSAKGGWGPTLLMNSNIFQDKTITHEFSSGTIFSGKVGLNFGDEHSLNFDFSSVQFNQSFEKESGVVLDQPNFNSFDVAILYRKLNLGRFVELGPVYSRITKSDDMEFLNQDNFGAILGFGRSLVGNDRFSLNLGLRFRYLFTDIVNEAGQDFHFPANVLYDSYTPSTPLSAMVMLEVDWAVGVFKKSSCYKNRRFIMF